MSRVSILRLTVDGRRFEWASMEMGILVTCQQSQI